MEKRGWRVAGAVLAILAGSMAVSAAPAAAASPLAGTLYLTGGSCAHGSVTGTYIQMILPSGSASGPYMSNSDSTCSNQAFTLLQPGSDGGLRFGSYQPLPSPPFDAAGNAKAHAITAPAQYEGTAFATSTNPVDPQTHTKVPAPTLTVHGSAVTADLRSFSVSWNKQYFNQGSPKPDGSDPGITRAATGTYDASTGAMTLEWTSQVVGGPFDKFTGSWHLVGKFVPSGAHASSAASARASSHTGSGSADTSQAAPAPAAASASAKASTSARKVTPSTGSTTEPAAVAATQAAVTSVVTKHTWHVAWWLIILAVVLALLGFGALGTLRRGSPPGEAGS